MTAVGDGHYDHEIWPMRSFLGRKMRGDIVRFEARRSGPDIEVIVQQEHGPTERFELFLKDRTPAARRGEFYDNLAAPGSLGVWFLAVLLLLASTSNTDDDGVQKPPVVDAVIAAPLAVLLVVVGVVLGRLYFWAGTMSRGQRCAHAAALPDVLKVAGDPRGQAWAVEALNSLRDGCFCKRGEQLHRMMQQPSSAWAPAGAPTRKVADLVLDAATDLREHGRLSDAGDVLPFVEAVPQLTTLDSETARQAAQTIIDSYQLLDEIPPELRNLCPQGSSTTPAQDAQAAVDGALRGIEAIVASEADSDIASLQALRAYSERWDDSGTG